VADDRVNKVIGIVLIGAAIYLLWRLFNKSKNVVFGEQPEPATTPDEVAEQFKGQPLTCQNIIYRPLSPWGPLPANLLGKGWCYRGDGSWFDGKNVVYGDNYVYVQAEAYNKLKTAESLRSINKNVIQFRLINSTASPITTKLLATTQDADVINGVDDVVILDPPYIIAGSGIGSNDFTANWTAVSRANGYYLDVATDSGFSSFVAGYNNLDVSNVTTYPVTGLTDGTYYYYRVRAYNQSTTSVDSGIAAVKTKTIYDDWFMPSKDELNAMYTNLYLSGIGGMGGVYWSSSEFNATFAWTQSFVTGVATALLKHGQYIVRACRSFISADIYSLGDSGPATGYIFHIIDNGDGTYTYYEAAPDDQGIDQAFSNVISAAIGTTGTAIGTGNGNTTDIIGQVGHTDSGAKLCDDYVIVN
jgi:hypothetical protein